MILYSLIGTMHGYISKIKDVMESLFYRNYRKMKLFRTLHFVGRNLRWKSWYFTVSTNYIPGKRFFSWVMLVHVVNNCQCHNKISPCKIRDNDWQMLGIYWTEKNEGDMYFNKSGKLWKYFCKYQVFGIFWKLERHTFLWHNKFTDSFAWKKDTALDIMF